MCLVLLLAYSVDSLRRRDRLSVPRYSGPWGLMALALLVFVLAVSGQWLAVTEIHPGIVETVKRGVGIIGAACWGVWLFGENVKPWQLLLMLLIIVATAGLALF